MTSERKSNEFSYEPNTEGFYFDIPKTWQRSKGTAETTGQKWTTFHARTDSKGQPIEHVVYEIAGEPFKAHEIDHQIIDLPDRTINIDMATHKNGDSRLIVQDFPKSHSAPSALVVTENVNGVTSLYHGYTAVPQGKREIKDESLQKLSPATAKRQLIRLRGIIKATSSHHPNSERKAAILDALNKHIENI